MSDITLASKEYVTGETEERLTLASKEYVDSKVQSYPENSFVFFYKDNDGKVKGFDATNATNGDNLFKDNQNIGVDWTLDMPKLLYGNYMFSGSNIKTVSINSSFPVTYKEAGSKIKNLFENCKELETVKMPMYTFYANILTGLLGVSISSYFKDCTKLKEVYLWRLLSY